MRNAIKRNDIENKDLKVNPESTWLNPGIRTIEQLKDWILTKLGYPLLTVELTDSQINSCIADGISIYSKYAYTPEKYLIVNTKFYKKCIGINLAPYRIMSIKDISFQRDNQFGFTGSDMFFGPYAYFGQGVGSPLFNMGCQNSVGTWTTYHMIHEWFDLAKRMLGSNPDWQYNKSTKILKIMPEPVTNKDSFILLTCNQEPPIEEYYGNEYCRRLILAECKILLGTIRKKFQGINLIGGGTIDTSIGDEGKEEKDKAMQELIISEAKGQSFYIC